MQTVSLPAVPAASFLCIAVSGLVSVGLPLGLAFLCCRRRRGALRAVLVGALCFFVGAGILLPLLLQHSDTRQAQQPLWQV